MSNRWTATPPPEGGFLVGDKGYHPGYGDGEVTKVSPNGVEVKFGIFSVAFCSKGIQIMEDYPTLSFVSRRVKRYQVLYRLSGSREWQISPLHFDSVASWRKTRATPSAIAEAKLLMESEVLSES